MIVLRPGCKINLGLAVLGKRSDGYHLLETCYYPLPYPADELHINPGPTGVLEILCTDSSIAQQNNLLWKAWELFSSASGAEKGYKLSLRKRIPSGAGLGGGSSDAAAFLTFLNQDSGANLPPDELARLAFSLGADVPFFLLNRPCIATGAGEILEPVTFESKGRWLLLVCPPIHVSTAEVFRCWDELGATQNQASVQRNADRRLTKAIRAARKKISGSCAQIQNDLEQAACKLWPSLCDVKVQLFASGAESAAMSGSGAAFYGIFASGARARAAAASLREMWPRVYCLKLRDFGM